MKCPQKWQSLGFHSEKPGCKTPTNWTVDGRSAHAQAFEFHNSPHTSYKYNTSINNTTFYFIYNGIFVRATCFDLVGHPQAFQENRSKSYLVLLHCGIPNAYKVLLQEHNVHKLVYNEPV